MPTVRTFIRAVVLCSVLVASGVWAKSIVIGYTGPLSGGAALYGKNTLAGLEMAAKEINAAGGVVIGSKQYTVHIKALDDQYSPSMAALNAKRLTAQYKAPIVFVSHSAGALALQAFNERDKFIIGAYTSVPAISERSNRLTFRIPPSFHVYLDSFVGMEMSRFGKKLAVATGDHDYARVWVDAFVPAWKKAGGSVVSVNLLSYNKESDFYSGISRALAGKPDVMLVGGASEPTALVIKQARELGFKGGFAVLDQAKMDEMARVIGGLGLLEGAVGAMPLSYDRSPEIEAFVSRYQKASGKIPGSEVAYHYTALNAVVDAMKLAGTATDAKAIFARLGTALSNLPPARNPSRIAGLDEKGAVISTVRIVVIEKGKPIEVPIKR